MPDLTKHPVLAAPYGAARTSLTKRGLDNLRLSVYLVVDFSRSMRGYFANGSVQKLAERVLALAAHVDDDGVVPVIFFDDAVRRPVNVSVNDMSGNDITGGIIERIRVRAGNMGATNYAATIRAVRSLHAHSDNPGRPAVVIFQTDGAPNKRRAAERELCDAATDPIFWSFLGFGDERNVPPGEEARFDFLRKLDTLNVPARRVVDNASFFPAGHDPRNLSDTDLYDGLMAEVPAWLIQYAQYAATRR